MLDAGVGADATLDLFVALRQDLEPRVDVGVVGRRQERHRRRRVLPDDAAADDDVRHQVLGWEVVWGLERKEVLVKTPVGVGNLP